MAVGRIRRTDHPATWRASPLQDPDSFAPHLEDRHLDALDAAVRVSKQRGMPVASLTVESFPLGPIASDIEQWRRELTQGTGFLLLRGFRDAGVPAD